MAAAGTRKMNIFFNVIAFIKVSFAFWRTSTSVHTAAARITPVPLKISINAIQKVLFDHRIL